MATGDIIGFINSDDFYHRQEVIACVVEAFKNETVQAVYSDVRFVNPRNLNKTVSIILPKGFLLNISDMVLCQHILHSLLTEDILKNLGIIKLIIR